MKVGTRCNWLRFWSKAGFSEQVIVSSGSITAGKFYSSVGRPSTICIQCVLALNVLLSFLRVSSKYLSVCCLKCVLQFKLHNYGSSNV